MWNTQRDGRGGHCRCPISVWSPYLPTMWAAIFGPAEPETPRKKTPEEIAAQKEARKKKAAEARKKREALEAQQAAGGGADQPLNFTFARNSQRSPNTSVDTDVPSESAAASNLPAISEDAVVHGLEKSVRESSASQAELITPKSAAAQESNVADLMKQVRLQHQEELDAAVGAARDETTKTVTQELESKFATNLEERLGEAAQAAARAEEKAVATTKAEEQKAASERLADALCTAESKHLVEMEAALKAAEERHKEEIAKITQELQAEHDLTRAASAALLRRAEVDGDSKHEEVLTNVKRQLSEQAAAERQAAVEAAQTAAAAKLEEVRIDLMAEKDRAAAKLEEVRIDLMAEKDRAVAAAIAETEAKVTAEMQKLFDAEQKAREEARDAEEKARDAEQKARDAEQKAREAKLAERQANFNKSFKALLKQLVDQPQEASSPKPLAIKYEQAA